MTTDLEERVTILERELAELRGRLDSENGDRTAARWERIFGSFKDSKGFDEAVRFGREYRESLRTTDDE